MYSSVNYNLEFLQPLDLISCRKSICDAWTQKDYHADVCSKQIKVHL